MKFTPINFDDILAKNDRVVAVNLQGGAITTQGEVTVRDGEVFKVLGYFASICRLSRLTDKAKVGLIPSINLMREADYKVALKAQIVESLKAKTLKS